MLEENSQEPSCNFKKTVHQPTGWLLEEQSPRRPIETTFAEFFC